MRLNHYKEIRRGQHGLALMFSLGILAVLTVIVLIYANRAGIERNIANAYYQAQQAQNMAESAVSRAIVEVLNTDITNACMWSKNDEDNAVLAEEDLKNIFSDVDEANVFNSEAKSGIRWIYIHTNANDPKSPIIGRIAYATSQYQRLNGNALVGGHGGFCDHTIYTSDTGIMNCTRRNGFGLIHADPGDAIKLKTKTGSTVALDHETLYTYDKGPVCFANTSKGIPPSMGPAGNTWQPTGRYDSIETLLYYMGVPLIYGDEDYNNRRAISKYLNFSNTQTEYDMWFAGGTYKAGDYYNGEKLTSGHSLLEGNHRNRRNYFHRFTVYRNSGWQGSSKTSMSYQGSSIQKNVWWKDYVDAYGVKRDRYNSSYNKGYSDGWSQVTVKRVVGEDGKKAKPMCAYDELNKTKVHNIYLEKGDFRNGDLREYQVTQVATGYFYPNTYIVGGTFAPVTIYGGRPFKSSGGSNVTPADTISGIDEGVAGSNSSNDVLYASDADWSNMCIPYFMNWTDSEGGWSERGTNAVTDKRNQIVANFICMGRRYNVANGWTCTNMLDYGCLETDIPYEYWGLNASDTTTVPLHGNGTHPAHDAQSSWFEKGCVDYHGKKSVEPTYTGNVVTGRFINEVGLFMKAEISTADQGGKDVTIGSKKYRYFANVKTNLRIYVPVESIQMHATTRAGGDDFLGKTGRCCLSLKFDYAKYHATESSVSNPATVMTTCNLLKNLRGALLGKNDVSDELDGAKLLPSGSSSSTKTGSDFTLYGSRFNGWYSSFYSNNWSYYGNTDQSWSNNQYGKPYHVSVAEIVVEIPIGSIIVEKRDAGDELEYFFNTHKRLEIQNLEADIAIAYDKDYAKLPHFSKSGAVYTAELDTDKNGKALTTFKAVQILDYQVNDPRHNMLMNQWTLCATPTWNRINSTVTLGKTDDQDAETTKEPACIWKGANNVYSKISTMGGDSGFQNLSIVGMVHRAAPWQTINLHEPKTKKEKVPKITESVLQQGGGAYEDGDFLLYDQLNGAMRCYMNGGGQGYEAETTANAAVGFVNLCQPATEQRDMAYEALFRDNMFDSKKIPEGRVKELAEWLASASGSDKKLNRRTDLFYASSGASFWNFFNKSPLDGSTLDTDARQETFFGRIIPMLKAESPWDILVVRVVGQAIKDVGGIDGSEIPVSRRDDKNGQVTTVQAKIGRYDENADLIEGECKMTVELYYYEPYNQWKILTVRYELD